MKSIDNPYPGSKKILENNCLKTVTMLDQPLIRDVSKHCILKRKLCEVSEDLHRINPINKWTMNRSNQAKHWRVIENVWHGQYRNVCIDQVDHHKTRCRYIPSPATRLCQPIRYYDQGRNQTSIKFPKFSFR